MQLGKCPAPHYMSVEHDSAVKREVLAHIGETMLAEDRDLFGIGKRWALHERPGPELDNALHPHVLPTLVYSQYKRTIVAMMFTVT